VCLAAAVGVWAITLAADALSVRQARDLLQHLAGANLSKDQVQVKKIEAGIGGGAIIEAQIETSFHLKKEKGDWQIAEVRLGDRQWESFELIEEAVKREKARRTTALLQKIADGLAAYQKERGQFAVTDEIAELLDYLSPRYLSAPPRFDLWGKQFEYRGSASAYMLSSAGPDGKNGTKDDLVIENGIIKASLE
ncbi:MAG: type II secretion system protein GspG, partial [Blastocatellia bacterium]